VLFKIESRTGKQYAMGQSEEEIITPIAQQYVMSYKDLPVAIYQIGQKYRDELRAKSGTLRGREFGMKDMYSFHETQEDFDRFYEIVKQAYFRIYTACGLTAKATEASGGSFSEKISYEFMVLTDAGEDDIVYCDSCNYCANIEVSKVQEGDVCPKCGKEKLKKARASEVGNVFDLGTRYPKAFSFTYKDKDGKEQLPIMGCYGLGTTRLMGVVVEKMADEKGMVWPKSIAPFAVHLVSLGQPGDEVSKEADALYADMQKAGIEVLYDDRDLRAGEKFADSDLVGIPTRVVVGKKTLESGEYEVVDRKTGNVEKKSRDALLK
jgi:prolyl-tRNA synthetase